MPHVFKQRAKPFQVRDEHARALLQTLPVELKALDLWLCRRQQEGQFCTLT